MMMMLGEPDDDAEPQQRARSELLLKFLRTMCELNGERCNVVTYEHSRLSGTFNGWKPDGSVVLIENLKTPSGEIKPGGLLRTTDIIAVEIEHKNKTPFWDDVDDSSDSSD